MDNVNYGSKGSNDSDAEKNSSRERKVWMR